MRTLRILTLAGLATILFAPALAMPSECGPTEGESLELEIESVEIGGSLDPDWVERAADYAVMLSEGYYGGMPMMLYAASLESRDRSQP